MTILFTDNQVSELGVGFDAISAQIELVSAGMGEVNERRELNALREWLADYNGTYSPVLQAEWNEWVAENEPQYDEAYD